MGAPDRSYTNSRCPDVKIGIIFRQLSKRHRTPTFVTREFITAWSRTRWVVTGLLYWARIIENEAVAPDNTPTNSAPCVKRSTPETPNNKTGLTGRHVQVATT